MPIYLIKRKGINPITKAVIWFIQWTRRSTCNGLTLAKRMARAGSYSTGESIGMMHDFPDYIFDELIDGNAVQIDGLGLFKLKVTGKSKANKEDVTSRGAKIDVLYVPDAKLISRLNDEKEFEFTTKVTEEGKKDIDGDTLDSSTGEYELDDENGTADTSTGEQTIDTSTNTADPSTGGGNDGMD